MASLLLGDLNDYIEPSQACIKPIPKPEPLEEPKAVTINLTDCLACSGCITSAESVLVAQQTYSQLLDALDSGKYKQVVVSVAPQSLTALAVKYKLSMEVTWAKLNHFLKSVLGVSRVVDVGRIRGITLMAIAKEFLETQRDKTRPFIVSACPGWVCYAEKRYVEMLPMMSKTRSPQQMAGVYVKHYNCPYGLDQVFHCTVMPCFDKKLEASREDFTNDLIRDNVKESVRDVDTVITTTELLQIIQERCTIPFDQLENDTEMEPLLRNDGSSSDAYLHYVLHTAINSLYPTVDGEIKVIQGRNSDHQEHQFIDRSSGKVLLRFAAIYGFKNIQTFVIKEKRKNAQDDLPRFDFVEIMACPSGCLNGGGQPKLEVEDELTSTKAAHKSHLAEMETVYRSIPCVTNEDDPLLDQFFEWVEQTPSRSKLLQTQYRAVEDSFKKTINVQW